MDGMPLMSNIGPTAALSIAYLVLATLVGPAAMKNRKPMNVR